MDKVRSMYNALDIVTLRRIELVWLGPTSRKAIAGISLRLMVTTGG